MAAPTNAALVKKVLANSEPSTHGPYLDLYPNGHHRTSCSSLIRSSQRRIDNSHNFGFNYSDAIIEVSKIDGKTRPHRRQQWPSHTT